MIKGLLNIIGTIGIAGSGTGLVIPPGHATYQKSAVGSERIQDITQIYNASNFGITSLRSIQLAQNIQAKNNLVFRITKTAVNPLPPVQGHLTYLVSENVINAFWDPFAINFAVQMNAAGALQVVSDKGVAYQGFALSVHGSVQTTLNAFGHNLKQFKQLFNLALKQPSWTRQIDRLTSKNPVVTKVITIGQNTYYNVAIDYMMGQAVFGTDFNCYFNASTNQIIFPDVFPV